METRTVVIVAGLSAVGLYFLMRRPLIQSANGTVVEGPSKIDEFAAKAGGFANQVGTKIGTAVPILRPIANLVGASAGMDTTINVKQTANILGGTKQIFTGDVGGGAKRIVTASATIAVAPIKTAYKLISGIF